jgi:tetratricopeptide (TPR) repeat protein
MPIVDTLVNLIPPQVKQQALDTLVDFVSGEAKKYVSEELSGRIKRLRSDAPFRQAFEQGLARAAQRFVEEYEAEDEDLVAAIAGDATFFATEEVQAALLAILRRPGAYLAAEHDTLLQSFDGVLPQRKGRERVNRAVTALLKCLAEELWHLPELQPVYSLQFQRVTAEAAREQIALQKAQLQALGRLDAGLRDALLQLTDAMAEQKLLPGGELSKPAVYHNLPQPDYGNFVGRQAELAQVNRILRPYPYSQHALVTIDGIGGIGKSALALEVAHRYLRDYDRLPPDERFGAIIWATAKQTILTGEGIVSRRQILRTLDDIYTTIAIALQREDITRARPDEQSEITRRALTRQRTLLILDNLETVDDEAVMSFLRELPAPTKAIVTTRHRLDVAYPVRLTGMPWEDARQLIAQECEKKGVILTDAEACRLFDRTGGVPLAIVWSVAQMGFGYGVEATLTRLGHPTSDIARFCFEGAVEGIRSKPAHRLLMTLSLFATNASREALGYVANLPELDRDDGLVELEKLSLVNKVGDRFGLLPLTESFAEAQLKAIPETEEILRLTYIRYFQEFCQKFGGEQWRLYIHLDPDLENIQLALQWAYQLGMWVEVGNLVDNLVVFLDKRALWKELVKYAEMAVEVGREVNDKHLVMRHKIFGLGWVQATRLRDVTKGLPSIEQGEKLAMELGDEWWYARALHSKGHIYVRQGNYDKAGELLQNSLNIWQKLGDQRCEIRTILMIGSKELFLQRNLDEAYIYYTQALKKSEEIGDTEHVGSSLVRLSHLLWLQSKFTASHSNAMKALKIYEQLNHIEGIPYCCLRLARTNYALGKVKVDEARNHAKRANEMFSKFGQQDRLDETTDLLAAIEQSPHDPAAYLAQHGVRGE